MFKLLVFLFLYYINEVEPTLQVKPTTGIPWPLPKSFTEYNQSMIIRPSIFKIKIAPDIRCKILNEAVRRYSAVIAKTVNALNSNSRYWQYESCYSGNNKSEDSVLDSLEVHFSGRCQDTPYDEMIERYRLEVNSPPVSKKAILTSRTVWGILRGLETFSQLIVPSDDGVSIVVKSVSVEDEPRFKHRGLLIDTSRHFLPVLTIKAIIDGMECNKLNVLHWHIVDDQSFPYQSELFPDLSEKGAYDPRLLIYTTTNILDIINYASLRGIRVLPEFDTPGHTLSWGPGVPGLLTKCVAIDDDYGPIDPTNDDNYNFLKQLFSEIANVFHDNYLHLGGDEVDFKCWKSNPNITQFMVKNNITTYEDLESYYIKKLLEIVQNELHTKTIVWQEVFDNKVKISPETIVHIWTGDYETEVYEVTKAGYKALLSTCWYLDHLLSGGDWLKYYGCEPLNFNGTNQQKSLVIGGEACMWGEVVDETNILQRIWPRASAAAEKLWSPKQDVVNITQVQSRIEEHVCRMRRRGIPAQPPNGPGFCIL
ncbi:beta-hexosaminidase subunit alpha-like [Lycorma delicatula]|uniref:beta-hexosaminidase subunit alpha-like n=1 Tax=Lycorma delicatula TaxID=130591 RepID=UPI003F514FD6